MTDSFINLEVKSPNDRFMFVNKYPVTKEGIIEAKGDLDFIGKLLNRKLLEGSSQNLSKVEIEDVEVSYKQIQEGKVFKSDNVEEVIAELKEGPSKESST